MASRRGAAGLLTGTWITERTLFGPVNVTGTRVSP